MKINKKEIKSSSKITSNNSSSNFWKILSITFILIFLLIIIVGLARLYHFNSIFHKPAKEDSASINSIKSVVYDYMINDGKNTTMDNIHIFDRVKEFDVNYSKKKLIGVLITDGNNEDFILVDIDSKEIMMDSHTEFYGWLNDSKNKFFKPLQYSKEEKRR